MQQMPLYMVFLHSFPETLILMYIGLALIGAKVSDRKVILIALMGAIMSYFVRILPLPPGSNVFIQLPIIAILLFLACKIPLWLSLVSIILGFLCVSFAELLFIPLVSDISGITIQEALAAPLWRILFPIPEFVFLTLLIIYLRRKDIKLFNTDLTDMPDIPDTTYSKALLILGLSVGLVVLGFYYQLFQEQQEVPLDSVLTALLLVIAIAVILSLALSWKTFSLAKQEKYAKLQQFHIDNLQEMMQIIKAQRHDFVNHLQVIYGMVTLGNENQVKSYIDTLYKDIQVTNNILQIAFPELSALLLVKTGVATARNISLEIKQNSDLSNLMVPPMELVTVVGNLLNNALEAVEDFDPCLRTVKIRFFEKPGLYIIQTQNPGYMPPDIKSKILEPGFSTKTGERGIGLASIKYQVEKRNGMVLVSSHPEHGTRFTICYPRRKGA
jgi:two-component system sensor histidine kinase AgrC